MKRHLLAIYHEELTREEIDQIENLCSGVEIEMLDDEMTDDIVFAYHASCHLSQDGYCYRYMTNKLLSEIFLVKKKPVYVGLFKEKDEFVCAAMGAYLIGVSDLARIFREKIAAYRRFFKNCFQQTSHLNLQPIKGHLKELQKDKNVAQDHIKAFFETRRLA